MRIDARPAALFGDVQAQVANIATAMRMGGRAVEGTGLENRQAGDRLVGSNPTPSATSSRADLSQGSDGNSDPEDR